MIFELNWPVLGTLVLAGALMAGCHQEPSTEPASEAGAAESPGFTHDRPPTTGGLEVLLQPGEDPLRPGYFDFGKVKLGEIVNHTFVLENKDPRRVTLQKVDPGCGCTVARIGKRLPDGSLEPALSDRPNELMLLEPGDVIESVDGRLITQLTLDEIVDRITGPENTPVELGIVDVRSGRRILRTVERRYME